MVPHPPSPHPRVDESSLETEDLLLPWVRLGGDEWQVEEAYREGGTRSGLRENTDENDERMKEEKKDGLGTIGASIWGRMDASSSLSRLIW